MGRKNRPSKQARQEAPAPSVEGISVSGWKMIVAGIALILVGFFVLSRADPMGRNWAAHLSPFLILGGYAVVAFGIFLPEASRESSGPPAPPSL